MEAGIPARLTPSQGRKFGLTVGLAFTALGLLVLLWLEHRIKGMVLLGLGGTLILAGLAVPTLLGPIERAWMGLAHLISKVTTPIFMGIVYFLVMTPTGLFRRRGGRSPIARTRGRSSWIVRTPPVTTRERLERQF
jgi:hypothetical protein